MTIKGSLSCISPFPNNKSILASWQWILNFWIIGFPHLHSQFIVVGSVWNCFFFYQTRKRISREVRKAWIHTHNYKNHQNSLTESLGLPQNFKGDNATTNGSESPGQEGEEYDQANFASERTDRGSGYTSIHLDSNYDHLGRQNPPPSQTRSLYDHSDYRTTASPVADTTYDHLDRGTRKTEQSNEIYDHMEKSTWAGTKPLHCRGSYCRVFTVSNEERWYVNEQYAFRCLIKRYH